MNKGRDKIYTAAELRRYHEGKMSPDEMHALERAALDDPMLADAIDGYQKDEKAEDNIKQLFKRLNSGTPTAKVVPLNKKLWGSVAAAASVVFLAGYAYFAMNRETTNQQGNSPIAIVNQQPKSPEINSKPSNQGNTQVHSDSELDSNHNNQNGVAGNQETFTSNGIDLNNKNNEGSFLWAQTIADSTLNKDSDGSSDKVKDENKTVNQLPIAKSKEIEDVTVTGLSNNSNNLSTDYVIASQKNMQVAQNEISLDDLDENANLAEVAVVQSSTNSGYNQGRKKATTSTKTKYNSANSETLFIQYLGQQKPRCFNIDGTPLAGTVSLQFQVNRKGRPEKIKVVTSTLSEACNKEAIRLLESGPDWEKKGPRNRTTTISFQ